LKNWDEEMEMAFREWCRKQELDLYRDRIFKFLPKWVKCLNVLEYYIENNDESLE
jgi:hypothetical protein